MKKKRKNEPGKQRNRIRKTKRMKVKMTVKKILMKKKAGMTNLTRIQMVKNSNKT